MTDTIIIDTREQRYSHIAEWFNANGIKSVRSKMFVGDYQLIGNGKLVIDRKAGLYEVYNNIINDHERFKNECERAFDNGVRIIFLVEQKGIQSLSDVHSWKNPRIAKYYALRNKCLAKGKPPASSATLQKAMQTMSEKYGIEWRFCAKDETAKTIVEILTNGG